MQPALNIVQVVQHHIACQVHSLESFTRLPMSVSTALCIGSKQLAAA